MKIHLLLQKNKNKILFSFELKDNVFDSLALRMWWKSSKFRLSVLFFKAELWFACCFCKEVVSLDLHILISVWLDVHSRGPTGAIYRGQLQAMQTVPEFVFLCRFVERL